MTARIIAVTLALLALLPVANLLPGGEEDPAWGERILDWVNGFALCAVAGVLVSYIAYTRDQRRPLLEPSATARGEAPAVAVPEADWRFMLVVALGAFALYAVSSQLVLSGKPLLIDEVVQVLQARWYVDGHLWVAPSPLREFFSIMHVVDLGDRVYGQFPAGGPAMLALGSLVGAEWLVGPIAGAVSVAFFARLLDHLEPGETLRWRRGATALFALAPFGVFMFASHMNHATTLAWLLVACVAFAETTRAPAAWAGWSLVGGFALGMAATIRPLDAVAFALPAAVWLAVRAVRRGRSAFMRLVLSGVGVAVPLAALLYVNLETTGAPLRFGYDVLWGPNHSIGFHEAPWGPSHTPLRGVELVSIQFTRLSTYLFELPFPAMLLVALGLWYARPLRALDRYLLASAGAIVLGYWAYWHDGYFLGPRFYFVLLPVLVLWSARSVRALETRFGRQSLAWIGTKAGGIAALALALVSLAAIRIPSYRNGLTSMRLDVAEASASAGVRDGLVLVRESWGARLLVRMWALGVDRPTAERIYRNVDVCRLESAVSTLEASTARETLGASEVVERLLPLTSDSASVVRSSATPGFYESVSPFAEWSANCVELRRLDERGHSHLAPFLLARDGNVYARWLPGREREIHALYPNRRLYMLERTGTAPDAPPVWRLLAEPID